MKKIAKKITSIMLSIVLMLGCIPSFGNVASAENLTIENIVGTVEGGFPSTLDNAWVNENGDKVIYKDSKLEFYKSGSSSPVDMLIFNGSQTVSDYQYGMMYFLMKFVMNDGKLDNIDLSVSGNECSGTYKPEATLITKIDIKASGVIYTNVQSLKYFLPKDAPYEFIDDGKWYVNEDLDGEYDFSTVGTAYKKLTLKAIEGYKFAEGQTLSLDDEYGTFRVPDISDDGSQEVIFIEVSVKENFSKSATITLPITAGTTVEQIKNNISITTTATEELASINLNSIKVLNDSKAEMPNGGILELDKEYTVKFTINDLENRAYDSVKVNNSAMHKDVDLPVADEDNSFYIPFGPGVCVIYKFTAVQPVPTNTGGSRKYKANDNDTAEKVSGSGKKGSTRTIVPEEGRKVSNVTVTDKKGNPIEVEMNEDGTYSFKQPASDVIINVDYASREIKMEVGTIGAYVDGVGVNEYVTPKVRNNEVMLPVRFIAENLGAKVDWNEKEPSMIYITRGDKKIEIKLGSNVIKVNGEEITLDSASFAEGNRTYVPFDLIEKALNATVELGSTNSNEIAIKEF